MHDMQEDILVDSELAKKLVPNKFKFTSKQGRFRRQKLLMAAKKLSATKPVNEISLAEVCQEAGIPRASAYHFFPNVEAIFLALRFLNALDVYNTLKAVDPKDFSSWQGYIKGVLEMGVNAFTEDATKAKLVYDTNTPDFEGEDHGQQINTQVVELMFDRISTHYEMPELSNTKEILLVTYSIINSIFTLSYRRYGVITQEMLNEAITASIAYLHCYFPKHLPLKQV